MKIRMNCLTRFIFLVTIICMIASVCANTVLAQSRTGCRREALKDQTAQFLSALEAKKPANLPLSPDVKYTENGKEITVGEGFWKTAGKMLLKRTVIDADRCGTHTQAVLEENGKQVIYGVRLGFDKSNKKNIAEIESFVAREGDFLFNPKGVLETRNQDWEGVIPREERSSRLGMVAAADDYFELFRKNPDVHVDFAKDCNRWENGTLTTGRRKDGASLSDEPGRQCSPVGLQTLTHKPRRFLVDREAGVVVAYLLFSSALPDFHMFRMRNGKIELMQVVVTSGSPTMGWPDEPLDAANSIRETP